MTENDYEEFVLSRAKPGKDILKEMDHNQAHLLHMAVGVAGEAGELLDAIKKMAIYQKPLDCDHIMEELGDLEYYMAGIRAALDFNRAECIQKNVEKLTKRYPEGYRNSDAIARADKEGAEADGSIPVYIGALTPEWARRAFDTFQEKKGRKLRMLWIGPEHDFARDQFKGQTLYLVKKGKEDLLSHLGREARRAGFVIEVLP